MIVTLMYHRTLSMKVTLNLSWDRAVSCKPRSLAVCGRQFSAEALGGPSTYSDFYGDETTVVNTAP
jgi:hypothetical protein